MNENVSGDPGPGHPFSAPFPSCCLAPSGWVISHHQAVGTTKGSPALSSGRGPQGGRGVSSAFDLSLEDPRVLVFCLLFSGKFVEGFREKLQKKCHSTPSTMPSLLPEQREGCRTLRQGPLNLHAEPKCEDRHVDAMTNSIPCYFFLMLF